MKNDADSGCIVNIEEKDVSQRTPSNRRAAQRKASSRPCLTGRQASPKGEGHQQHKAQLCDEILFYATVLNDHSAPYAAVVERLLNYKECKAAYSACSIISIRANKLQK